LPAPHSSWNTVVDSGLVEGGMKQQEAAAWTNGDRIGLAFAVLFVLYLIACLLVGPVLTAFYECGDGSCSGATTKEWVIVT
jgi:hypothetical protein